MQQTSYFAASPSRLRRLTQNVTDGTILIKNNDIALYSIMHSIAVLRAQRIQLK